MADRHDDNDGSDIFWPGYVDATTNLILNLLFLLTILIVAVFMFALELGRSTKIDSVNPSTESSTGVPESVSGLTTDAIQENIQLKIEVQRLTDLLAQQSELKAKAGGIQKTVEGTHHIPVPQSGIDKTFASNFELLVRFKDEAVTFTSEEHDRLIAELKPVRASEKTSLYVQVPAGFSEAKRLGFYRAMAVRNLLIEMDISGEDIDVAVVEVAAQADPATVRVRSH